MSTQSIQPPQQQQPLPTPPQQQTKKSPNPPPPQPPQQPRLPPPYDQLPSHHQKNDERMRLHNDVEGYVRSLELSPHWIEVENRPWSNDNNRWQISGCQGYDFVQYDPRVRMRFFWNEATQTLSGSAFWDNRTEGPSGGAYGGSIMLVFDEILAYPVWRSGTPAFTANVNLNLRKMLPFNTSARFESKIIKVDGRKVSVEAKILSGDGVTLYADAKGLWISSNGIGSSGAIHPETMQQDGLRKVAAEENRGKYGDFVSSNALNYPMYPSAAVISSVSSDSRMRELYEPQSDAVLPYQKQVIETSLGKEFISTGLPLPPQAIRPRDVEVNHGRYLEARL